MSRTVKDRFPQMLSLFSQLPDTRGDKGRQYRTEELLTGGLSMFLFKQGSRNRMNNLRRDGNFQAHYQRMMFGHLLPHQDAVADLLFSLPAEHLEQARMNLMSNLFEQKWLRQYRLLGKYYMVAVDATGIVSFDKRHCAHCLTKKSKNGKETFFHYVLEAKLVTSNGFAFSLASEWIENPAGDFNKQDCERNAFIRLAAKIKKQYPRLPICILADGLYPYANAFKICEENGWKFIFVLQDKSLKTVQDELTLTRRSSPVYTFRTVIKGWNVTQDFRYQTGIEYQDKYTLNWIQCDETRRKQKQPIQRESKASQPLPPAENTCFEYVTNLLPDRDNVREIATGGRLRWKIENEGFNIQKCGGYEIEHKYCHKSYTGLKNYYSLLQIAHAINQLIEKGKCVTEIMKMRSKETLSNLWDRLRGYMVFCQPLVSNDYDGYGNIIQPSPT